MSEKNSQAPAPLTPKEWVGGIGALLESLGFILLIIFLGIFALEFYRSTNVEDLDLPGGRFSPAMYDAQFCANSPNHEIRKMYESTRIGLWFSRTNFRSQAYEHADDALMAMAAAKDFERVGDAVAANQAIEDAQSRLRQAVKSYVSSTCFDVEAKRRTY